MQTTWRVENSSRERFDWRGVTINRNGPVPDCSRRSWCFWSGAVNSHTVTEVITDITDTPTEPVVMEQGLLGYLQCVRMLSAIFPPPLAVMAADVGCLNSE